MIEEKVYVPVWLVKLAEETGASVVPNPEGIGSYDVEIMGYTASFPDAADVYWFIKLILEKEGKE